jgi:Holliday junction resolvasome RuvABC endonuclease subunit
MANYLLALDQSSKTTGWAVFDRDSKTLLTHGKFTLDDDDLGIRLNQFRNKVEDLINLYSISFVVFENIQM